MKNLNDKVVLITGAAGGIGKATALEFAQQGCHLVLCDILESELNNTAQEIEKLGVNVLAVTIDVSKENEVASLYKKATDKFNKIDIIMCNAGIGWTGPTHLMEQSDWDKVFDINFFGVIHFIRHFTPSMIERREGHVIIISSIFGITGIPFGTLYAASKSALISMGECLRSEFDRYNIGVTTICPGLIETGLIKNTHFKKVDEGARNLATKVNPMSADKCAQKIVRAVKRNKGVVIITTLAKTLMLSKRLSQRLFEFISLKIARSTQLYINDNS